jgi:hypothetical protein
MLRLIVVAGMARELMQFAQTWFGRKPPSIRAIADIPARTSSSCRENHTTVGMPVVPVVCAAMVGAERSETKAAGILRSADLGVGVIVPSDSMVTESGSTPAPANQDR